MRSTLFDKVITAGETTRTIGVDRVRSLAIQSNYDVVTPSAKTFDSGSAEIDTLTFADKATSAHGDYVAITDINGDKWAVALSKQGIQEVSSITTIAEGSVAEQTQLVCTAEGSVKNVTQVTTVADISASLAGTYFKVYDAAGSVGVWFSIGGVPATAPSTFDRDVEVAIAEGDTDAQVAGKITTAFAADLALVVGNVDEVVTITDVAYGARTAATDGGAGDATGFTIETPVAGHDSNLDGKYFILKDEVGTVGFWFDVDDSGTLAPTTGAARDVEITTITSEMTAAQVGTAVYNAIHADTKFNGVSDDTAGTIVVVSTTYGNKTGQSAGTSGFTVTEAVAGADSAITGKYFVLGDVDGSVAFWFDVGNEGTAEPSHGAARAVEITSVTRGMTSAQVAGAIRTAVDADSKFDVGALTDATFQTICKDYKAVANISAGDSGFTVSTVTQGADLGAPPTGVIWTSIPGARKAQSDISATTTADTVAAAVRATLAGISGIGDVITVGSASGADVPITHGARQVVANPVPKNTGDTGAGTITVAETNAGVTSEVDADADTLSIPSHGFTDGAIVTLTTTGTLPAGLAAATDYTVKVVDANTIQLYESGSLVDITDEGADGSVNTVTHTALAGCSVQFQKSCDGVNWVNEGSAVSITADGTNILEIDEKAYTHLQAVVSLTSGVVDLEIIVCGI